MKNLGQVTENQDIARKQDIPTNTSDLTNDSGFITSVKTLKTDNTTSQSTSAGEALNGSGTINLHRVAKTGDFSHIQNRYDAYITWGGNIAGGASPLDVAINSKLNPNRLAFMDANDISIEYSTDGGNTWVDYGVSNADKINFVSGLGTQPYFCGGTNSNPATNYQIRVTIIPTIGRLYFSMRKIHIYLTTNGCTGNKVTVSGKYFGSNTFKDLGTYNVAGWSGWNTISMTAPVGGFNTSQTTNIQSLRFTFYYTGKQNEYPNAQLSISQLLIFGDTIWSSTNNMQRNGTIYSYDYAQNVSFPANLTINKTKLINNASSSINVNLPTQSGTLALTSQIPPVNNGTLTIQKNGTSVGTFTANQSGNSTANITVPTKTSDLTNDSGFITSAPVTSVNNKTGAVTLTASDVGALPSSTIIPTALSQLSADATHRTVTDTEKATWNSKSSFSGSYTDLTNKPTIPTVNNGTLTIQKNGTKVQTFTANQSTNVTANITVPTKTSDLTNDSGFITSAPVTSVVGQTGDVTKAQLKTGLEEYHVNGSGFCIGTNSSATFGGAIGNNATETGGGFAGGNNATVDSGGSLGYASSATTGGAVGLGAEATTGGAIGQSATAGTGGAVGQNSSATTGFAGGYDAKATASGAVQLGNGTNAETNTLQFKSYQLLNASGKIPAERLNITVPTKTSDLTNDSGFITSADLPSSVTSVVGQTGDVTASQIKNGIQTSDGGFAIGTQATAGSGCACGAYANATEDGVAIGNTAVASDTSVAIGYEAVASEDNAIQLGTGRNSIADTLQFMSYKLVNENGCVPIARNPLAQKTWAELTSSVSATQLFGGTAVSSGNITLSNNKSLMDYRMVFVLGSNDYNNGAEWFMFYGWQLRKFYDNTTLVSFKLCSSYDAGHWEITRTSLSSTTLTVQVENMKIFEIWGVE